MKLALLFAAAAAIALPAATQAGAPQRAASIAFANMGGVDDWRADGDEAIYFKDNHRRWYRAELLGPCFDLPYTEHIGIDAHPSGRLDRFGAIYVRGQRCSFTSFERVAGPPSKNHRRQHKD